MKVHLDIDRGTARLIEELAADEDINPEELAARMLKEYLVRDSQRSLVDALKEAGLIEGPADLQSAVNRAVDRVTSGGPHWDMLTPAQKAYGTKLAIRKALK